MSSRDNAHRLPFVAFPVTMMDCITSVAADQGGPEGQVTAFFLFTGYSWHSFSFSHSACH